MGSRKIEIQNFEFFGFFQLFSKSDFKISDFRKFRFFQLLVKKNQKKSLGKFFHRRYLERFFIKSFQKNCDGDRCLLYRLRTIL